MFQFNYPFIISDIKDEINFVSSSFLPAQTNTATYILITLSYLNSWNSYIIGTKEEKVNGDWIV